MTFGVAEARPTRVTARSASDREPLRAGDDLVGARAEADALAGVGVGGLAGLRRPLGRGTAGPAILGLLLARAGRLLLCDGHATIAHHLLALVAHERADPAVLGGRGIERRDIRLIGGNAEIGVTHEAFQRRTALVAPDPVGFGIEAADALELALQGAAQILVVGGRRNDDGRIGGRGWIGPRQLQSWGARGGLIYVGAQRRDLLPRLVRELAGREALQVALQGVGILAVAHQYPEAGIEIG